jgi:hypothetical protein
MCYELKGLNQIFHCFYSIVVIFQWRFIYAYICRIRGDIK